MNYDEMARLVAAEMTKLPDTTAGHHQIMSFLVGFYNGALQSVAADKTVPANVRVMAATTISETDALVQRIRKLPADFPKELK